MAHDDRPPEKDAVGNFLSQPAAHYEEDEVRPVVASDRPAPDLSVKGFVRRFVRFMFEKKPSPYSSIAPRRADGTRTKIFPFNGGGRGR